MVTEYDDELKISESRFVNCHKICSLKNNLRTQSFTVSRFPYSYCISLKTENEIGLTWYI